MKFLCFCRYCITGKGVFTVYKMLLITVSCCGYRRSSANSNKEYDDDDNNWHHAGVDKMRECGTE